MAYAILHVVHLTLSAQQASHQQHQVYQALHERQQAPINPLDCVAGQWDAPPVNVPTSPNQPVSDGAFTGNGDLGMVAGASPVAPATLAFYIDLMQFRCPTNTGKAKCGYGTGGHVGVGWLGVQLVQRDALGTRTNFSMQQIVETAEIKSQSVFSSGVTLHSRAVAYATANLALVELWFNGSTNDGQRTLDLQVCYCHPHVM